MCVVFFFKMKHLHKANKGIKHNNGHLLKCPSLEDLNQTIIIAITIFSNILEGILYVPVKIKKLKLIQLQIKFKHEKKLELPPV